MGLLDFFSGGGRRRTEGLVIDLRAFACGHTRLGHEPDPRDFFAETLRTAETCAVPREGFEVGTKAGRLDSFSVALAKFSGGFQAGGRPLPLGTATTPADIQAALGEPYWTDTMDAEAILFYEFESGRIELQFEFPDRRHLAFLTLMRDGVLSDAVQRSGYRVTKSWPPI